MRVIVMSIIDKINRELMKKGKNGAEMSRDIGLSNGAYSQWNTGKTRPSKKTLLKVAEYLGVSVEYLMEDDEIKEKPTDKISRPKNYEFLNPENRAIVDLMIEKLYKSQLNDQ